MEGYELIQEPFYTLRDLIEIPAPLPDEQVVTIPCTLIRVRKGDEHVLFCVPEGDK